ncbi:uncharacterized protein LOC117222747 isoform X2 [Megalopta genalis]|uniref:uncharacterized protein LOC117222747 isoform X2 n=1 Tax=Megalopta genalis TaxID=115081 RepID=UPI0014432A3A|nr:uncharacterized protein LOC117222747 isoform X2 [Megalopta genalis]
MSGRSFSTRGEDAASSRQRSTSKHGNRSSSDSELAQGRSKGRRTKSREKWPLLDGLTVDELARYRRRRVQGQPKDNLGLHPESEDRPLVEPEKTIGPSNEDSSKENVWPEGSERVDDVQSKDLLDEGAEASDREEIDDRKKADTVPETTREESVIALSRTNEDETMETQTESSKYVSHFGAPKRRPSPIRRGTTLKRDGQFYTDTETYSSYVAYAGQHRPELARRATSLRMEGDLQTTTEKCEKFVQWLNVSRPGLMRVPTHLKLEGEIETTTENHEKYVPFVGVRRPELLRQHTNLKLEGESNFMPEYTEVFKRHSNRERPQPVKPETHLRTGTEFFKSTENAENFINPRAREAQLMGELNKDVEEEEKKRREQKEKKTEEEMKMLVSKLEDLKGPPLEVPEYKDAYKNFPRGRPKILKPEDEIGRADGSKIPSSPTSKFSTKIDQDPEYKSKYLDYQRDHPVYRKPPLTVRSTLVPQEFCTAYGKQDARRYDYELTSEVRSQYVPYGCVPKVEPLRMPSSLRLEGNLDLEPEYRTAYCTKRESQCANPRMHRRRDHSLSASRRRENHWINNVDQIDHATTVQDRNAFQVLKTRIHEDNVCGKPPSGSRRHSRTSQIHLQKLGQLDAPECSRLKDESSGPSYRLHVCNVDDEPQGFRRRRSPSLQSSGRIRNPSPDRALPTDVIRPYSPSFGKSTKQHNNDQSFVVLDNEIFDSNKNEIRRKMTDRNYNIDGTLAHSKGRNRATSNWMPPWYDSTNTI